jgi:hypothetical protein
MKLQLPCSFGIIELDIVYIFTTFKLTPYEVLMAVTKMAVFWVVAPCSLVDVYQHFRGPCCLHHQCDEALMMEAARASETLVNFYQTTRRYNPEDWHLPLTQGDTDSKALITITFRKSTV